MIRRHIGNEWLLIAQDDHARLSGLLAAHLGNQLFDTPADVEQFTNAVSMHDRGWIDLDRQPVLNESGQPGDVFETHIARGLRAWTGSSERAAEVHPLAGLLVSLHSLSLSVLIADSPNPAVDLSKPATRFALNKFQHRQIELQEQCRIKLGLSNEVPLHHGLSADSPDPREKAVVYQFRMLQAMDKLSLALCCTKPPQTQIKPVHARPGGRSITFRLRRTDNTTLHVSPWPFNTGRITFDLPAIRMRVQRFGSDDSLQSAINAAARETLTMTVTAMR